MLPAGAASAAIGIDVTTSTDRSTASTTIASPALSTVSGNELLLAFISTDYNSGASTTVTNISGGNLTWVPVIRTDTQSGDAEIWRAFSANSLGAVTVTATLSQSVAASMTVMSFTGVDTSGANGSGAIGATRSASASSGAPTASLVTTRANSWVFGVGDDFDNAVARTLGSGQTSVHQYLATVGDTYWVQRQTSSTPSSGTTVTINDTAPTGDRYNLSIVEILAAVGGGTGPANITATIGTPQSATINTVFGTALQATVRDGSNNPVTGATVTFAAPGTGASGSFTGSATVVTNTNGVATAPTFTANAVAGGYTVTASVSGVTTPASFSLTNNAGPAASITATGGTLQSATIKTAFGAALQATVKDGSNNPLGGVVVTFLAPGSGASGTFSNGTATITATTTSTGVAAAAFTANSVAGGPYSVTATAGALGPANFQLTNNAGPAANITATAGTPQSATVNTAFATALQAKVTDASNNAVSGVSVTFTAPGTGASGTFSNNTTTISVTTNSIGAAAAPFTANGSAGGPYIVTASASGVTGSVSFNLTNNALPPSSITSTAGTPQSATINTGFATNLQATVKDANNNPVAGVTVTFTAPGSGASGTFLNGTATITATTDSNGVALPAFTASSIAGGYTVTAKAGTIGPANFALTNTAGLAASVAATAGTPQSATINTAFATNLQATVKDASNNPVNGVTVTFTAPGSGASGTFAGGANTATTNTSGVATSATFTANGIVGGPYTVIASATGATSANFSLTNNPANPVGQTLFTTQTPALAGQSDGTNVNYELGTLLQSTATGQISAIRFWKDSKETGTHTGRIWSNTGTQLASVVFVSETASGWQQQALASPVTIAANTTYVVSVNTGNTYYVATNNGLSSKVVNGNLTSVVGNNGVYGPPTAFPTKTWQASNYFRDVVFSVTSASGPPASIIATAGTPQSATINTAFATALQAKVTDASNNPVSGVSVTFLAPGSGASGTFSNNTTTISITTNSSGVAAAPFTANSSTGGYTVMASAAGLAGSVSFSLTNSSATPNITSLSPTSGPVGTVVTIGGTNFGSATGAVNFNGTAAPVTSWSGSSIVVTVPAGATSGNVVVTAATSVSSNGVNFTVQPLQLPSQAQVLAAIQTVNNYWISKNTAGNSDWAQATYFTGDLAAYDATRQANYLSFAQTWATKNSYSLVSGNTTTWPDYQAAGQPYIRLYQLSNNASDLTGITQSIGGMVNTTVDNEWTWVDAINMSMPNFAELGSIYSDTNYYTKMYALYSYSKYSLSLYNPNIGLWWRDASYVNTSTYWSRGNGWAFADHAKVLSVLPTSDPHYAEYLSTFITMAQSLATRQQPGGYWNSDLGGTDYAGPESSGTSFFLYGLAWGVNNGILDQTTYLPIIENAWNFLANTAIQPSGFFGYVQPSPPCNCPGPTSVTDTADYGVGAFLLAARQMALLTH